ncbi:hypothetical protein NP233_g9951 [Leucocoprinus birnbaumii]|uniref:Uncharacterized protein n=1 Tax=Leucocoprinus birnbaumii TaxID=56174 RepID=A0AAD5VN22_9AGAR|nr:hypothetical protein NP233_g9951 [Leucocoprinus birnbaumii]
MLRCSATLVEAYLRKLETDDNKDPRDHVEKWIDEPVNFSQLETLLWEHDFGSDCEWVNVFFKNLHTPVLSTLAFSVESEGPLEKFTVEESSFISRLPLNLRTLMIEAASDIEVDELGPLLGPNSPLEYLCTRKCGTSALTTIFDALLPSRHAPGSRVRMPLLKSLSISDWYGPEDYAEEPWELTPEEIEPLVAALERRFAEGGIFKIELSGFGVDWMPSAQKRLRDLVGGGVELEIIEDGEPVHWLR